jgi:hypothetical protein
MTFKKGRSTMGIGSFWDNAAMFMGGVVLIYFSATRREDIGSKATWLMYLGISLLTSAILQFVMEYAARSGGH